MKRISLALVAALIMLAGCQSTGGPQVGKEVPSDGKYSLYMPGTPATKTQTIPSMAGPIDLHVYFFDEHGVRYILVYNDFPATISQAAAVKTLLDSARNGAIEGFHGKLVKEDTITLTGNYPGRDIQVVSADGKRALRSRMYVVKNRLYQIGIAVPTADLSTANTLKYLDSFKAHE